MTRMSPLLKRNEHLAVGHAAVPLGPPSTGVVIVTCLDHRVDPAEFFALATGEAPVIRNAGGRVTDAVINDVAYLAFLAEQLFAGQIAPGSLFEVAVIHHTQCGTGLLADPAFLSQAAHATGLSEATLAAGAVADPYASVVFDLDRLLASPRISPRISASGHVYDVETGRVTTVDAVRHRNAGQP